ncbi:MAG: TRAP transporter small permease subunit [Deltaproteobacteria bacterium]|nr:MAG: TRAP transporter small permease subunit [Deltaproteobacteria bacterium]
MQRLLLAIPRAIDALTVRLGQAVAWLSLVMVLIGAGNAVLRYLGRFVGHNLSSNAFIEAQWYLFSALFLLGAAWTLQQDRHVRVDVLYGRLSPRARAAIDLAGTVLFLLPFCAFATWVSFPSVAESWRLREVSPDPGGLPRYPVKALVIVAWWLLIAQGVSQLCKHLSALLWPAPAAGEGPG